MKYKKYLLSLLLIVGPFAAHAAICNRGTGYQINQCLTGQMTQVNTTLQSTTNLSKSTLTQFDRYRKGLCGLVSNRYHGGTYQSISYGNCYISLTQWFQGQMRI